MLTGLALLGFWITQPTPIEYYKYADTIEQKKHKKFAISIKIIFHLIKELLEKLQNQKIMKSDDRIRGEIEKLILKLRKLITITFVDKEMNEEIKKLIQELHTLRLMKSLDNRITERVENLLQELDEAIGVETYERTCEGIEKLLQELQSPKEKELYYQTKIKELIKELLNLGQIIPNNKEINELIHELQKTKHTNNEIREIIKILLQKLPELSY